MTIKLSLIDNDFVIQANTNLDLEGKEEEFGRFFRDIGEELATGNVACLEIEGPESETLRFEISKSS